MGPTGGTLPHVSHRRAGQLPRTSGPCSQDGAMAWLPTSSQSTPASLQEAPSLGAQFPHLHNGGPSPSPGSLPKAPNQGPLPLGFPSWVGEN